MKVSKLCSLVFAVCLASACGDDKGSDNGNGGGGQGACTNDADMAVIDAAGVDGLGCEGAKCAVSSLGSGMNGAAFSIDTDKVTECVKTQAPTLKKLSTACQKCFVEITECVPNNCVELFGASSNACNTGGVPSTDFNECKDPKPSSAECMECQKPCQTKFVECSGLEP